MTRGPAVDVTRRRQNSGFLAWSHPSRAVDGVVPLLIVVMLLLLLALTAKTIDFVRCL